MTYKEESLTNQKPKKNRASPNIAPEKSTYAKVVMMISEDENRGTVMVTGKEIHHYIDRNGVGSSTETEDNGLVLQYSNIEIVDWEWRKPSQFCSNNKIPLGCNKI
ncbi:hypothetical protein KY289_013547 [Solanum tuberosum]|nr:hypothetical protein KY289_013547 [Solanum tuberosum]